MQLELVMIKVVHPNAGIDAEFVRLHFAEICHPFLLHWFEHIISLGEFICLQLPNLRPSLTGPNGIEGSLYSPQKDSDQK